MGFNLAFKGLNCEHVTDIFEWKFAGTEKVAEPLECYVIVE
jgi:hypothetical protein